MKKYLTILLLSVAAVFYQGCTDIEDGLVQGNTITVTTSTLWFDSEGGSQLLEFRSRELFLRCVDQYSGRQYRYQ